MNSSRIPISELAIVSKCRDLNHMPVACPDVQFPLCRDCGIRKSGHDFDLWSTTQQGGPYRAGSRRKRDVTAASPMTWNESETVCI